MKRISFYKVYEVTSGEKSITANINIGFGQQAITQIFLDGSLVKTDKNSVVNLAIGTNAALQFKRAEFKTVITNTQRNTNEMNYDFGLAGGVKKLKIPAQNYTATSPGELFIINTKIDFL